MAPRRTAAAASAAARAAACMARAIVSAADREAAALGPPRIAGRTLAWTMSARAIRASPARLR
jgi:hypothetical protein